VDNTIFADQIVVKKDYSQKVNIGIYILYFNQYEKIKICLQSFSKINTSGCEIVIVNNASTDGRIGKLKADYPSGVRFLEHTINDGYAGGNNFAIADATEHNYKYAYLLNSDIEVIGINHIATLYSIMNAYSDCGIASVQVFDSTEAGLVLTDASSLYLTLLDKFKVLPLKHIECNGISSVMELHGCALFIRVSAFNDVGGLPRKYFLYVEESTLEKKMRLGGYTLLLNRSPQNYIIHHHPKTGEIKPWQRYLMGRNHAIEYFDNRKVALLRWSFIYWLNSLYYNVKVFQNKEFKYYTNGIKEGKRIYKLKLDDDAVFDNAVKMKNCENLKF
jgi:GT2 family glycosyltransferase